jgi:peptidyl-prolyl cis-trans isomerase C
MIFAGVAVAAGVKTPEATEIEIKPPEAVTDKAKASDTTAATVNGAVITESEVQVVIRNALQKLQGQVAPQLLERYRTKMRDDVLDRLIAEKLLEEQIKKKNIKVSDKEINKRVEEIAARQKLTVDDLKALLEAYGKSIDELKEQTKQGLAYEKLIELESAGSINATEEEAKKYYEENIKQFTIPEEVRASHILISTRPTEPNSDPAKIKAEAKEKIEGLLRQVKEGADFAELARRYSACPTAKSGGDLGYFATEKMVPEFEKAVVALGVGEISGIVETRFGYHIIKVTGRKEATKKDFADVKDTIIKALKQKKQGEFVTGYVKKLKEKARIVYTRPGIEKSTPAELSQMPEPSEKAAVKPKK